MNLEKISIPEANKQLPDIPKSKEIFSGDINDAVITVQKITGYEITPEWWSEHVGNDGSTEEILERFDVAFEKYVREQIMGIPISEQETDNGETLGQNALNEADEEYAKFHEKFKDDPEFPALSQEFLEALHAHLLSKYWPSEATNEDSKEKEWEKYEINVEIVDEYTDEELQQLEVAVSDSLVAIDRFLDGKTRDVFKGLTIKVGEDVSSGAGKAESEHNLVALNGRALLLSLKDMRSIAGYDSDELVGSSIDDSMTAGALRYTLVHEMGHILDELTEAGEKRHRVEAAESPTKYGREADEWNTEKDHEAFAEGFAHMVYDMPVSETLARAILETIKAKLAQNNKKSLAI